VLHGDINNLCKVFYTKWRITSLWHPGPAQGIDDAHQACAHQVTTAMQWHSDEKSQ